MKTFGCQKRFNAIFFHSVLPEWAHHHLFFSLSKECNSIFHCTMRALNSAGNCRYQMTWFKGQVTTFCLNEVFICCKITKALEGLFHLNKALFSSHLCSLECREESPNCFARMPKVKGYV